jgi:hypothetical protein
MSDEYICDDKAVEYYRPNPVISSRLEDFTSGRLSGLMMNQRIMDKLKVSGVRAPYAEHPINMHPAGSDSPITQQRIKSRARTNSGFILLKHKYICNRCQRTYAGRQCVCGLNYSDEQRESSVVSEPQLDHFKYLMGRSDTKDLLDVNNPIAIELSLVDLSVEHGIVFTSIEKKIGLKDDQANWDPIRMIPSLALAIVTTDSSGKRSKSFIQRLDIGK